MNAAGWKLEHDLLGEPYVYPGHAVTIAMFITHAFPNLEAAEAKGNKFPGALESGLVPGAGGNVYSALSLLRRLRDGMAWNDAVWIADRNWASCDQQGGTDRWRMGQEQADRMKPVLRERVGAWLKLKDPP